METIMWIILMIGGFALGAWLISLPRKRIYAMQARREDNRLKMQMRAARDQELRMQRLQREIADEDGR